MVRIRSIAAYVRTEKGHPPRTHVRSKTPIFSFMGGHARQPLGGEVGLHKGFDTEKAPDTPPGCVDDIVGGFQIIPALVGNQRIAEPLVP